LDREIKRRYKMIRKERDTIEFYDKYGEFDLTLRLKKGIDLKEIEEKIENLLEKENIIDEEGE